MSLLEDVRALYCSCDASEGNHSDACIEKIQPRIVAALEAAQVIAEKHGTVWIEDLAADIAALAVAMLDEGQP